MFHVCTEEQCCLELRIFGLWICTIPSDDDKGFQISELVGEKTDRRSDINTYIRLTLVEG